MIDNKIISFYSNKIMNPVNVSGDLKSIDLL